MTFKFVPPKTLVLAYELRMSIRLSQTTQLSMVKIKNKIVVVDPLSWYLVLGTSKS